MTSSRFAGPAALALGLAFVATLWTGPAGAWGLGEAGELEHARANARAGGPVSERDAELLERYGCLSGTRHSICDRSGNRYERTHRVHRKHRRMTRDW